MSSSAVGIEDRDIKQENHLKRQKMDTPKNQNLNCEKRGLGNFHSDLTDKTLDTGLVLPLIDENKAVMLNSENFDVYQPQHVEFHRVDDTCIHEICYPVSKEFCASSNFCQDSYENTKCDAKLFEYELDSFQKRAISCVERKENVLISAHTSAGKTTIAEYAIAKSIRDCSRVIYTSPIKALSNQKYRDLQEIFHDVGLMTGDVSINPGASCIVMTTEILRNMLYRGSEIVREVAQVIFDEIHYMKDRSRGVVWEECLILLPTNSKFVFLSATIPNAAEFACQVAKLNKAPCNVVYTEQRPVPLEYYLFPKNAKGLYLVVDKDGNFKDDNFQKAISNFTVDSSKKFQLKQKNNTETKQSTDVFKVTKMILARNFDPVIVFSFSKRDCEANAMQMSQLDFCQEDEKELIGRIFENAIDSLSEDDQKLPQVNSILPLLKRGIGIHHSGLLPILKEVIEILFQEGLLKCLFATETFSMGLNMPARTVVFSGLRKFDGVDFRTITSGEFIQMSGRAGRRGIDNRGIVILMCDEKLESNTTKSILKGSADRIYSSFHLSYNMLLNLLCIEDSNPEYMIQHSFYQFQLLRKAPELKKQIENLSEKRDLIKIKNESEISNIMKTKNELERLRQEMKLIRNNPENILRFLNPGRVVKIIDGKDDWGQGIVVNFLKIDLHKRFGSHRRVMNRALMGSDTEFKSRSTSQYMYLVDVLLKCKVSNCDDTLNSSSHNKFVPFKNISNSNFENNSKDSNSKCTQHTQEVIPCELTRIDELSSIRLYLPSSLKSQDARLKTGLSLEKLFVKFNVDLPCLDPIEDMKIVSKEFEKIVRRIETVQYQLSSSFKNDIDDSHEMEIEENSDSFSNTKGQIQLYKQKIQLQSKIDDLKKELKSIEENESTRKSLKSMKRVLRRLDYIDDANIVKIKGRVACTITTADELIVTELLFNRNFNDLNPAQIVSLCSTLVSLEKTDDTIRLRSELGLPFRKMQEVAKRVAEVMIDSKIEVDLNDYVETFQPYLMEVVYEWCKGAKFSDICKMTSIFEGSIIRSMRRLEELLGELVDACKVIGNNDLGQKFESGINLIKRDIIFAASLYL